MDHAAFWRLTCPSNIFIKDLDQEMECTLIMLADDNNLEETVYMPEVRGTIQKNLGKLGRLAKKSLVNSTRTSTKFFTLEGLTSCDKTGWDCLAEKCLC